MNYSHTESSALLHYSQLFHHDGYHKVIDPIVVRMEKVLKSYVYFHLVFFLVAFIQICLFGLYFVDLFQTYTLAIGFASVFFTCFTFFAVRLYLQTKKPEQLEQLIKEYVQACKSFIGYQERTPEHHISLAKACCKFANSLHAKEYTYYRASSWLEYLAPTLEKWSAWWHWEDFHLIRELLLEIAVAEHIKLVKCLPTNLEAHAALANAYVMLSGLYIDPRNIEGYDNDRWIPPEKFTKSMDQKFRENSERAIEEFKILCEYAPDDPWVHRQLAYSYRDLRMPQEEIKEYEILYRLNPEDLDILFTLGYLYLQQGLNAKGLKIYDQLRKSHYRKAENLIKFYGSTDNFVDF